MLCIWFGPGLYLEMNWSDVREKFEAVACLWSKRNIFHEERAEICDSLLPSLRSSTSVVSLRLFLLPVEGKSPIACREVCCLYTSGGGLRIPGLEISQHTLRLNFQKRMCSQVYGNGKFWKENTNLSRHWKIGIRTKKWDADWPGPNARECRKPLTGEGSPVIVSEGAILNVNGEGKVRVEMILLTSSALRNRNLTPFELWRPYWNVSTTIRHRSPGWCYEGPSESARSFS